MQNERICPEELGGYTLPGYGNSSVRDGKEVLAKDVSALGQIPPKEVNSVKRYSVLPGGKPDVVYLAPERRDTNRAAFDVLNSHGSNFSEQQVSRLLKEKEFKRQLDGVKERVIKSLSDGKMPFVTNDPIGIRALIELKAEWLEKKYPGINEIYVRWVLLDTLSDSGTGSRGTLCLQVTDVPFGRDGFEKDVNKLLQDKAKDKPMSVYEDFNDDLRKKWKEIREKFPILGQLPSESHKEVLISVAEQFVKQEGEFVIRVSSPDVSPIWFSNRGILEDLAQEKGWKAFPRVISEKTKGNETHDMFLIIGKSDVPPESSNQHYKNAHNMSLAAIRLATNLKQAQYLKDHPVEDRDRRVSDYVYAVQGMKSNDELHPVEFSNVVPDLMVKIQKMTGSVGAPCTSDD